MTGNYLFIVAATLAVVFLVGCGNVAVQEDLDLVEPKLFQNEGRFMEAVKLQSKLTALQDENQTLWVDLTKNQMEVTELEMLLDDLLAQNQGELVTMEDVDKKLLEKMVKLQAKVTVLHDENQTLLASLTKSQIGTTELEIRAGLTKSRPEVRTGLNYEADLNCDSMLRNQLTFQRGASTKDRMQVVIAQIQAQQQECARGVWQPVAIDMDEDKGLCYSDTPGRVVLMKVGGQALPKGLQMMVGADQVPQFMRRGGTRRTTS